MQGHEPLALGIGGGAFLVCAVVVGLWLLVTAWLVARLQDGWEKSYQSLRAENRDLLKSVLALGRGGAAKSLASAMEDTDEARAANGALPFPLQGRRRRIPQQ